MFFKDKTKPNLLTDFDCIGFDVDHTFVKYNVAEITRHIIQGHLQTLRSMFNGYPEKIKNMDYSRDLRVFMNYAVWDIQNGTIIKLSENRQVTHAMMGFEKLTALRIKAIYGDPPLFLHLKWPQTCWQLDNIEGAHWVMLGNFDSYKLPIICQIVDMIKNGEIKKSYQQFAFDLFDVSTKEFVYFHDDVHPIQEFGRFYPDIVKNPNRFIQPQPELRNLLSTLKAEGIQLFLATNSHSEYLELTLKTTLGENWREFFDIFLIKCRKPLFQRSEQPFYSLSKSVNRDDHKGKAITTKQELCDYLMQGKKYLVEGSSQLLTQYFQQIKAKEDVKVAFVGDDYLSDIHATYEFDLTLQASGSKARWYAITVVEEMTKMFNESSPLYQKYQSGIPHDQEFWGPSFFVDEVYKYKIVRNGVTKNYFVNEMSKVARYAVPSVHSLKWMLGDDHPLQKQNSKDNRTEQTSMLPEIDMKDFYERAYNLTSQISASKTLAAEKAYALYQSYQNSTYLSESGQKAKEKAYQIYNRYKNTNFTDGAYDLYNQYTNSTYYNEAYNEGKKQFEIVYEELAEFYRNSSYRQKKQQKAKIKALKVLNSINNSTKFSEKKKRAKEKAYEYLKSLATSAFEKGYVDKKSIVNKMSAWRDYIPPSIMPAGSLEKLLDSGTQAGHVKFQESKTQDRFKKIIKPFGTVLEPTGEHTHTLVFLHGLNGSGQKYEKTFLDDRVIKIMPKGLKILLPTSPKRPVTLNGGKEMRAWYDVRSFSNLPEDNIEDFCAQNYSQEDIKKSAETVIALLKNEIKLLDGQTQKVFLSGFSQGCCVSLATYLLMENFMTLGGIFGVGGGHSYKVDWDQVNVDAKKKIPLFFYHGGRDPVIPVIAATRTYAVLKAKGIDHFQFQVEPGLQHTCSLNALKNLASFLKRQTNQVEKSQVDLNEYKLPSLTVDAIVTKPVNMKFDHFRPWLKKAWKAKTKVLQRFEILLITRKNEPFKGKYAFPGGFVNYGEDPDKSVLRELEEECSIVGYSPEIFMVAGDPERDPRRHVISLIYTITAGPDDQPFAADDAATAQWYNLQDVVKNENGKFDMAFDHRIIFEKYLRKFYQKEQTLIALEKFKETSQNASKNFGGSDMQIDGQEEKKESDNVIEENMDTMQRLEAKLAKDKAYLLSIQKDLDDLDKQAKINAGADGQEIVEQKKQISDWPVLESSACVFSSYMHQAGMSKRWSFEEIYGFRERELLELTPRPVLAVIANIQRNSLPDELNEGDIERQEFFIKQNGKLKNACGIIACFHSIFNNIGKVEFKKDHLLYELYSKLQEKSPEERADILESMKEQISEHIISSESEPQERGEPNSHFVTFILNQKQELVLLDGLNEGPVVVQSHCKDLLEGSLDHLEQLTNQCDITEDLDVFSLGFNTEYIQEQGVIWPDFEINSLMLNELGNKIGLNKSWQFFNYTDQEKDISAVLVDIGQKESQMTNEGKCSFFMQQIEGLPSALVASLNAIYNHLGDQGIQISYGSILSQFISMVHDKTSHDRGLTLFTQNELQFKWRELHHEETLKESQQFVTFIVNNQNQLLELDGRLEAPKIVKENCQNLVQDVVQEIKKRLQNGIIEKIPEENRIILLQKTDLN